MKVILKTNRLLLREITNDDFPMLKKVIRDNNGNPYEDEYVWKWLNWCKESYKKDHFGLWAVIYKENNEMIGNCGVSMQFIDDEWRPEIGYHLRKDYHQQGIGKEMTRAVKDYFFSHYDYDEVFSYLDQNNVPSEKTAIANGMTLRGIYKEIYKVYSITRKEWEESRGK